MHGICHESVVICSLAVEFPAVLDNFLPASQMPPYRGGGWDGGGWVTAL